MSEFNQRYDFDRDRRGGIGWSRLRPVLITLAVIAVTGAIIYLLIPHGGQKGKPATAKDHPEQRQEAPKEAPSGNDGIRNGGRENSGTPGAAAPSTEKNTPVAATPGGDGEAPDETEVGDPLDRSVAVHVKPGDKLERIAEQYRSTVDGIMRLNGLKNSDIRNDRTLKVIPGPWRIKATPRKLVLEQQWKGKWTLFKRFDADTNGTAGEFVICSRHYKPDYQDRYGRQFKHGDPDNPCGDYLLKLARRKTPNAPELGFVIHGVPDKAPELKCGRGHIHVGANDIEQLYYLVPKGTEVSISRETGR